MLTHVCSEHPEHPLEPEVVIYLSHPLASADNLYSHRHTAILYPSWDFGNVNISIST